MKMHILQKYFYISSQLLEFCYLQHNVKKDALIQSLQIMILQLKKIMGRYYVSLPSNLQYTITNTPNSGLVGVQASATNENFFTVLFFEDDDSTIVTTVDGNAAHSYSDSGTYRIKIRAHLTYTEYIELVDSVEISINSGGVSNVGYSTPMSYPNYTLVWNDEFNGTSLFFRLDI